MDRLISVVPCYNEEMTHQTALSDISDEEFGAAYQGRHYKWYHRVFQLICFIIFLGPIRMVLSMSFFAIGVLIIYVMDFVVRIFDKGPDAGKEAILSFAQWFFKIFLFICGHVYIKVNGKIDPDTRIIISNHTSFADPFLIVAVQKVTCVIKAELQRVPIIGPLFKSTSPVFVSRDRPGGATHDIQERCEDPTRHPVLIYPEGTLNNGDVMMKFHLGAFLTKYKVQPLIVKYWMPLVPKGWNSLAWTQNNFLSYMWCAYSVPFSFITVDVLPAMTLDKEGEGSSEKFALYAQMKMANFLGVKAISRSSHEIFRKSNSSTSGSKPKPKTE